MIAFIIAQRDIEKRLQHLELFEWKYNHPDWFKSLFNITTAYMTINEMFKIKPAATLQDFNLETYDSDNDDERQVCMKTLFTVKQHDPDNETKWSISSAFGTYRKAERYLTLLNRTAQLSIECFESKPIKQTNIIGYINYKHAVEMNDVEWINEQINQILNEFGDIDFDDIVSIFRTKYYQIPEHDEQLFSIIHSKLKNNNSFLLM